MNDKLKQLFNEEFFEIYKPDEMLIKKADNSADKAKAIRHLSIALTINPENDQAKQKLLELYPKAIQDVVDDGRYEDAFSINQKARLLIPDFRFKLIVENLYILKINQVSLAIKKVWDFSIRQVKTIFGSIVGGDEDVYIVSPGYHHGLGGAKLPPQKTEYSILLKNDNINLKLEISADAISIDSDKELDVVVLKLNDLVIDNQFNITSHKFSI